MAMTSRVLHRQIVCTGIDHTTESASAVYSRIMEFKLTGYDVDGQELKLRVSGETEALATAVRWDDQGLRDIRIQDAARAYTLTEFALRIINSGVR